MRSRMVPLLLALALVGLVLTVMSPAQATSGYEMWGGGTLTAKVDPACSGTCPVGQVPGTVTGMPACTRFTEYANQGDATVSQNCNTTKVTDWQFGSLPIFSNGYLFDKPQAATYNCVNSTVQTVGGTDNFKLNFSFNCDRSAGTGWSKITGNFSTTTPGCTLCGAGRFYWEGEFRAAEGSTTAGPVAMRCGGGFEPTGFGTNAQGPTVTAVLFEGECTAVG